MKSLASVKRKKQAQFIPFYPNNLKFWGLGLLLSTLFGLFCLQGVEYPQTHNFDEFHYMPAAKRYLAGLSNPNWEHPPLAKLIMSIGLQHWGDHALGWRIMSILFGSITLLGMGALAQVLFGSLEMAIWVMALSIFNQFLYVQSRIGMLDTFMMAFIVWGFWCFSKLFEIKTSSLSRRIWILASGVLLGLGTSCKWFSVIPALGILFSFILASAILKIKSDRLARLEVLLIPQSFQKGAENSFLFLSGFLLAYLAPFFLLVPAPTGILDLWEIQKRMYDGQLRVTSSHPYMSQAWQWPFSIRPIWYAFDREQDPAWVRGVLLIGNPIILWPGILAVLDCIRRGIQLRPLMIALTYLIFYGSWFVIPRKIAFYYYYYPAAMWLSFAWAELFWSHWKNQVLLRWSFCALSAGFFIYFFPILSAQRIPTDSFRSWMWIASWI